MAENVLLRRLRQLGKKRWGKRFQQFRRDAPIGNPRDPLIGFPVAFLPKPETDNQELIADNWFIESGMTKKVLSKAFLVSHRS